MFICIAPPTILCALVFVCVVPTIEMEIVKFHHDVGLPQFSRANKLHLAAEATTA